jgi:hypothetical protein
MKPEWFRNGIFGDKPDPAKLEATHTELLGFNDPADRPVAAALEVIFASMQAERWSPNGEARARLEAKGLEHTSMSVGDVVVDNKTGDVYVAASFGFDKLTKSPEEQLAEDRAAWPKHPDGTDKKIGEMTAAEASEVHRRAIDRLKPEFAAMGVKLNYAGLRD